MNDEIRVSPEEGLRIGYVPPEEPASDPAYIKHVRCEGARWHVVSWSSAGRRCSEPRCILNKPVKADDFHAHLDECVRCREMPFALCPKGEALLRGAASGVLSRQELEKEAYERHRRTPRSPFGL